MEVGEEGDIYLSLHCHLQNDSCIKMGNDESHFNVSLTVRDKVTRQCPQTTTCEEKGGAEADSNRGPSAYQPDALPLGQTCSLRPKSNGEALNSSLGLNPLKTSSFICRRPHNKYILQ